MKIIEKVTIREVAKESGVSTATVSRVLNDTGYVSDEIKSRVLNSVKNLNYQPNAVARSLKQSKTNTIGVIIPDISNPYFMKIAKGIEDRTWDAGYNLIFSSSDGKLEKEHQLLKLLVEQRVDAIVLVTSGSENELAKSINESGTPVILIDRRLNHEQSDFDLVEEDNVQGAYYLTEKIIQRGHTRIGVIAGSFQVSTGTDRYEGLTKALKQYNIPLDENLIYIGDFTRSSGEKAVDYFLSNDDYPRAIISFNNLMTEGVLYSLFQKGFKVPKDFDVASYGGTDLDILLEPPGIITISQDPYKMGIKTGDILLKRLVMGESGPFYEKFTPEIVY
ncbi:LacI family DNA-binding transcriptional regulator [Mesobacillus harenae]|uniref:LacI family DNA-binding transcriptional regulator n=1 Tax=Mesobacillus harenae TaxID=2213203 RepID=UPI0018D7BF2B|nr:LacI family DNA-binding transcriptional regulator [Mesobacillus harenae]